MKAVRVHQPGSAANYVYEDAPDPTAGPGEVRVRVKAVALNHLEAWAAKAPSSVRYNAPRILGADVAGVVEDVGAGVTSAGVMDRPQMRRCPYRLFTSATPPRTSAVPTITIASICSPNMTAPEIRPTTGRR